MSLRRASKVDANQGRIVSALRKAGASVQSLAATGQGVPDLLVGYRGANHLLEVKDGSLPPSARNLTPAQVEWHDAWKGTAVVVLCEEDALREIGATK